MFTGEILQVGQTSTIVNANLARTNFGYDGEPVIVIARNGKAAYIHTLDGACVETGGNYTTLEDAMEGLLTKYNGV